MNTIKLLLMSCLLTTFAHAQRYETARSLQLSVGYIPNGYSFNIGGEQHFGQHHSFVAELGMFHEKEKVINTPKVDAKFLNLNLTAKYRYYASSLLNNRLFPLIGGGLYGGYEIYSNKKDVPSNIFMDRKSQLIYGLTGDIGAEYNFYTWSLFFAYSPIYEFKMKDYIHHVRFGVKYIF